MNNDQCRHCTARGNLRECMSAECSVRESWYAKELEKYKHLLHEYDTSDMTILVQEREELRQQRDALAATVEAMKVEKEALKKALKDQRRTLLGD